jgi:transposase
MPSPKLVPLVLSDAERASLEARARKRTASQSLAQRARIVLACAEDSGLASVTEVAARLEVSREIVRKQRVRFLEGRMHSLAGAPWPGAPRKITDEQVEVVVTRTLREEASQALASALPGAVRGARYGNRLRCTATRPSPSIRSSA